VTTLSRTSTKIFSLSPKEVWVLGYEGGYQAPNTVVSFYDGNSWSMQAELEIPEMESRSAQISGNARDDLWIACLNRLYHFDGNNWSRVDIPAEADGEDISIFMGNDDIPLALGEYRVYHYADGAWQALPPLPEEESDITLRHISGSYSSDIWVVGTGSKKEGSAYGVIYRLHEGNWELSVKTERDVPLYIEVCSDGRFIATAIGSEDIKTEEKYIVSFLLYDGREWLQTERIKGLLLPSSMDTTPQGTVFILTGDAIYRGVIKE
jgi:hypothetical protein